MADDGTQALQFDRVEGAKSVAQASCAACRRAVPDLYYEAGGKVFCAACKDAAVASLRGGSRVARLLKASVFGVLAAAVSAGVWYAIIKITGYELGIVAVFVGIAVGMAVRVGSEGRGGWAYQSIAVVLTYLAIGSSYVPLVMDQVRENFSKGEADARRSAAGSSEGAPSPELKTAADTEFESPAREFAVVVTSIALGLALPVLQVMDGGFIGLLIVGFALYQAWKINKRRIVAFSGPFRVDAPSPASVA